MNKIEWWRWVRLSWFAPTLFILFHKMLEHGVPVRLWIDTMGSPVGV